MGRGHKRDRKDGKKGHRQLRDREKRARTEAEEDESMMDMDPADDVSVVGTRKRPMLLDGPFDFTVIFPTYLYFVHVSWNYSYSHSSGDTRSARSQDYPG